MEQLSSEYLHLAAGLLLVVGALTWCCTPCLLLAGYLAVVNRGEMMNGRLFMIASISTLRSSLLFGSSILASAE